MHNIMSDAGRNRIKELLAQLKPEHHKMFKLMYGRGKFPYRSVEETKAMDINDVVDEMDEVKLSTAIDQCERTIANLQKQKE